MNEALLQFIWQFSLFETKDLETTDGQSIVIVDKGKLNKDAGPDFFNARVKIGGIEWVGNLEIHLKSSDWNRHLHQHDPRYLNVVLHVVLDNDWVQGAEIDVPVLCLRDRIKREMIAQYIQMMESLQDIPCQNTVARVPDLIKNSWLQRCLVEKWELKFEAWHQLLQKNNGDWLQLIYTVFLRNLGARVNDQAFEMLAQSLPLQVIAKHKDNLSHVEALLFGQAGLLPLDPSDEYEVELSIHYAFFKKKYQLSPMDARVWKNMRMRPSNFPTIRIAQLAMLLYSKESVFSKLLKVKLLSELNDHFQVGVSQYWLTHYVFGKESKHQVKHFGKAMQELIWINTIAPIRYFYGLQFDIEELRNEALIMISDCPPEQNSIIEIWKKSGVEVLDAASSQALLYLYRNYCSQKKCLACGLGHWQLKH